MQSEYRAGEQCTGDLRRDVGQRAARGPFPSKPLQDGDQWIVVAPGNGAERHHQGGQRGSARQGRMTRGNNEHQK